MKVKNKRHEAQQVLSTKQNDLAWCILSPTQISRFMAHLVPNENGCIEWDKAIGVNRYGQFTIDGKQHAAHRVAWFLRNKEPIMDGLVICHTCDNKACVNPDHLFLGDYGTNTQDYFMKKKIKREIYNLSIL